MAYSRVQVDCQNREVKIFVLSPEEEAIFNAEKEERRQRDILEQKKTAKRLLVLRLAELREMKQNRDIFDDADLAEKQAEIDALKSRLTLGNPQTV